MSLLVPSYASPYSVDPLTNTYIWIGRLSLDLASGAGRVILFVHPSAEDAAAGKPPLLTLPLVLGPATHPGGGGLPTLAEFLANQDFAMGFATIRAALYDAIKGLAPFADATDVP
jgi:hypothetical protein